MMPYDGTTWWSLWLETPGWSSSPMPCLVLTADLSKSHPTIDGLRQAWELLHAEPQGSV